MIQLYTITNYTSERSHTHHAVYRNKAKTWTRITVSQNHGTLIPWDRLVLLGPQLCFVTSQRRREETVESPEVPIGLGDIDLPVVTSVDDERFENLSQ
jgi:hypothetical protein